VKKYFSFKSISISIMRFCIVYRKGAPNLYGIFYSLQSFLAVNVKNRRMDLSKLPLRQKMINIVLFDVEKQKCF
jgi:hypothetical protein